MVAINNDLADIPSVNFSVQGSDISAPGAARAQLYFKSSGLWYILNGGTATQLAVNPMTAQGDIIIGGASGALTRLAKGTKYKALAMNAGETAPEWASAVHAEYTRDSAQSMASGSPTVVNYDDVESDPLSLVTTGANWVFTCPCAGLYLVTAQATLVGAAGWATIEAALLGVRKNAGTPAYLSGITGRTDTDGWRFLSGATLVNCAASDTLDIVIWQNNGAAINLLNDASYNHVAIGLIR